MQLVTHDHSFHAARTRRRTAVLCLLLTLAGLLAHDFITAHRASSAAGGSAIPMPHFAKAPGGFHPAPVVPATTTLAKKVYAVVDGASGVLVRGSHAVSAARDPGATTGIYTVTFDRHVDNCALTVSNGTDGTASVDTGPLATGALFVPLDSGVSGFSTSSVLVETFVHDSGGTPGTSLADSDFHIIGLCPST